MRTMAVVLWVAAVSCSGDEGHEAPRCTLQGAPPDSAPALGCAADFEALASAPLSAGIPGARSVKTILDRADEGALYYQDSARYPIHWDFAHEHLSGHGLPLVPELALFNATEYYSPDRRFVLGALTHYEGPDAWVLELTPYDTAPAELIEALFRAVQATAFCGDRLGFHPTSEAVALEAERLPDDVPIVTTDDLFGGIDYQPLNLATALGRLRFERADHLDESYVGYRDIVVLDRVPNDITVVAGLVTAELQTPLSHVNVLSQNRGTPNMGLRGADADPRLRALEGAWVRLEVGASDWSIEEVDRAEADAWWEEHRPARTEVPRLDLSVTEITSIEDVLDPSLGQRERIRAAIPAFGGKASHFAELASIEGVPTPHAFVVPVSFYVDFVRQNGFDARIAALLADEGFTGDARTRDEALQALRDDMEAAPVDEAFAAALEARIADELPGVPVRFRSSTNAEDLEGFTGAGLYTSKTGDPADPERPVLDAVRKVWASVWTFRAFEEREYRGIAHETVGMALLVHRSFPDEYANGVALTANPFDAAGLEPGFYVNVQRGDVSVVLPDPGVTTDQFIYQFDRPNRPIVFYGHSNQIADGETVLSVAQTYALGQALDAIHAHFRDAYGPPADDPTAWYGMDVEFKFDAPAPGADPVLVVKQARPLQRGAP